jgi:antirestriction protein ArdC
LAPVKKNQIIDREVWDLGVRMGVAMTTQMWPMPAPPITGNPRNTPVYLPKQHRISVPDPGRYRPVDDTSPERSVAIDLLHEYVHSTMKIMDRPRPKSWGIYAREELVAEIGANIMARRLGFEQEDISWSQFYLQHYKRMLKRASADDDTVWAVREARRAATHILQFHTRGGWTESVNTTTRKTRRS